MKPGTVYTLERGAEVLGTLTVTDTAGFAVHATFEATPAFAPYRVLFDEDARLAQHLAADPDPALLEAAEAFLDSIVALGLVLRGQGGTGHRTFLIGIEGDSAHFRPLSPEEEPL
ncbi:hypothetical protein HNQ07_001281 [Deinococcus metalli]|uniref:Uncharacterized protein n=1 Tax=Deinococcus metalli TaxID=1141878 RepID=A0A7W8KFY7_9DEIO|nr:hypothetical protein [Deinococcus metalli]MBB5375824.1 hypothetical protein [Deinococcus metalli]GHF36761.1 hypothetical protein GCM10017781_11790 [Deinococcus metalli]